jgi:Uma2 family endonuclease
MIVRLHRENAMSIETPPEIEATIHYPESDGQPMADNTLQFRWIVTIQGNLDTIFANRPDVFVAGDLLWYPVQGKPGIRRAPDALVVFGRPKGDRGSYLQWREDNIAPQVVFEILSPGNTLMEMAQKFEFYDTYGVEEYYLYDPDHNDLSGWQRHAGRLRLINPIDNWVSPRLGICFRLNPDELLIERPDGRRFLSFVELHQRADHAEQRADHAEQRAAQLTARLRELGIDPDV